MGVLAAAELEDDLQLVPLFEEFLGMAEFGLVVVRSDLNTELDLLDLAGAVFVLLLLFGEFVFELSEIGDAADGGISRRGDLDQVEAVGPGFPNGLVGLEDAELLAGGADDDADFACANAVVDADECWINGIWTLLALFGEVRHTGVRGGA